MRRLWRRIRTNWNRVDTVMALTNLAACILFIGNCWWESIWVCYTALVGPLALQTYTAWRHEGPLRDGAPLKDGVRFGALVGALWPLGEGVVVNTLGWWGQYLTHDPYVWETPLCCILIGWLASTHILYWSRRITDIGYGTVTASVVAGLTAFGLGVAGENLFVGAKIWVYEPSELDWWGVPAFVPIAYGVAYTVIPPLRRMTILPTTLVFTSVMLVVCVGLGLAVGYFPR